MKLTLSTASWSWNGSHPSGEVAEKKTDGDLAIKSSRGNTIKAPGSPSDPAVHLARPGNDVVKKQSDLDLESKGDGQPSDKAVDKAEKSKADEDPELHLNGGTTSGTGTGTGATTAKEEPKTGDKRKATEEPAGANNDADEDGEEGGTAAAEQPEAKKARGRPKGNGTPSKKKKAAAAPKKQKKEGGAKVQKPVKEKKAPAGAATGTAGAGGDAEKKGRGRPKKDGSAGNASKAPARPKKDLKTKAQPVKGSMGTRTRSRA